MAVISVPIFIAFHFLLVFAIGAGLISLLVDLTQPSSSSTSSSNTPIVGSPSTPVSRAAKIIVYDGMTSLGGTSADSIRRDSYALYDPAYPYELRISVVEVADPEKVVIGTDAKYFARVNETLIEYVSSVDGDSQLTVNIDHLTSVSMDDTSTLIGHRGEGAVDIYRIAYSSDRKYAAYQHSYEEDKNSVATHVPFKFYTFYDNASKYQYENHTQTFAAVAVIAGSQLSRYTIRRVRELSTYSYSFEFTDSNLYVSESASIRSMFVHDIDGDGNLDIAFGTQADFYDCDDSCDLSGGVYVLYGSHEADSQSAIAVRDADDGVKGANSSYGYNFVWDIHGGDVDDDGHTDLVVALKPNSTTYELHLYLGEGNEAHSSTTIVLHSGYANLTEAQPVMLRVIDIDQDGLKDVVFVSTSAVFTTRENYGSYLTDLNYEGPSTVGVILQEEPSEGVLRFGSAYVMHATNATILKMDTYPPSTNQNGGVTQTEVALSESTIGNVSIVECVRFLPT
ncbi:hypothetical protein CYMTET_3681 [Cymbomonas tetramitiformis]|uniref:Uncharacterized protein n=1 Tax=Cymbomonas tetramitiformis TaxID=36881 RepID=A0AAE0LKT6_9CHLO|nr:hypothetical protein CYMTET_3681 [Cymbomonas tetramitiformis]|eukprot:gene1500-2131_t